MEAGHPDGTGRGGAAGNPKVTATLAATLRLAPCPRARAGGPGAAAVPRKASGLVTAHRRAGARYLEARHAVGYGPCRQAGNKLARPGVTVRPRRAL